MATFPVLYAALGLALALDTLVSPGVTKLAVWALYGAAMLSCSRWFRREEVVSYRERFEALQRQAMRDPLTGLFHRGVFESVIATQLARAVRSGASLSLLMVDVDRFKQVNDAFGHREGDEVLRAVARALRGVVRASDFPCRFGGEEFALLLPDTGPEDAVLLAERIRTAVTQECRSRSLAPTLQPITVSIGIASAPTETVTPESLVELADRRLYEAKAAGRNRIAATGSLKPGPTRHLHVA